MVVSRDSLNVWTEDRDVSLDSFFCFTLLKSDELVTELKGTALVAFSVHSIHISISVKNKMVDV